MTNCAPSIVPYVICTHTQNNLIYMFSVFVVLIDNVVEMADLGPSLAQVYEFDLAMVPSDSLSRSRGNMGWMFLVQA